VGVEIEPVKTREQWREFHRLPYRIYADDTNWVPPLLLERKLHFSVRHNPFFQHAEGEFWLARKGGRTVGRVSAQIDRLHLDQHAEACGHFGALEAINDSDVFARLLNTAERWLRQRGVTRAVGPLTFSLWGEPGLLVEGFDRPPSVMMGHAWAYYATHIESAGYEKVQDLLAYEYTRDMTFPPAAVRILDRAMATGQIIVRPIRKGRRCAESEIALLREILNDAWSDNWGFVPMTAAEMADIASVLKLLVQPKDIAIAEYQGRAVAFTAVIPNVNEAIRDLGGRLAPWGWAKLLWRLKVRGVKTVRMPLMGVRREFQASALGAAFALATIRATRDYNAEKGAHMGELSWILESNRRARHIVELVGARPYKRYRIYEKNLGIGL
jgi:hypothetical protein